MKQKDNRSTGALIVSLTFAVVVFTALYIQYQPTYEPVTVVETPAVLEDVNISEAKTVEETVVLETNVLEEVATAKPPRMISFANAYAIAREALGPDQTFTWNGRQYSTNTAEEEAHAVDAQRKINLTDVQDSLVSTLSHSLASEL
jgi:hypothetical protein